MKHFVARHQPRPCRGCSLKAGVGALLGIGIVAWLTEAIGLPLLIAPFGASAVLLFAVPDSPLAQPANVIGGHVIAALLSLALDAVLPDAWWATALAVGVVIGMLAALRLTHPPAGADPLVVMASHPGLEFVLMPVLAGSVLLVLCAWLVHCVPPRQVYPLPPRPPEPANEAAG